jgi:peptidoglycan/xylan/chitin deacetylase (PgdA/CDA1 family)
MSPAAPYGYHPSVKLISLMYHDIEPAPSSRRYSFTIAEFREHLAAIKTRVGAAPSILGDAPGMSGFALTFDDGKRGCLQAAEALEEHRWKAFFFIITGVIGKTGYLDRADIRRLAGAGHVVGSHSADHPRHITGAGDPFILDQWRRSKAALEEILGREVTSASVPGGFYSARVARAAASAGIRHLFTSEPVATSWTVESCRVWGRYKLTNGMSSRKVAGIAAGARAERALQFLAWNLKKPVKAVMLAPYLAFRKRVYPS